MKTLTEELRKQFENILGTRKEWINSVQIETGNMLAVRNTADTYDKTIDKLLKAVEDYFKQNGKKGGDSTKRKHPNHFKEAGTRGAMKRWEGKKV